MMLLSRFWYVILSLLCAFALYVAYVAVGQYNRRAGVAINENLASDSQVVGWALQIDARRRLDALVVGSLDKSVQESLVAANAGANTGAAKIPAAAKDNAKKALDSIAGKVPADFKSDAMFVVDRDGRVVAQHGYDQANAFDDFELGGFAAVNDAIHGYLRDDSWVLGGRMCRVVARPVEVEAGQAPVGAIVGLRWVDKAFADAIAKRTRANVAFYVGSVKLGSSGSDGIDDAQFAQAVAEAGKMAEDKSYKETGRSEVRAFGESSAAMYARLVGESWDLGGGYLVLRPKATLTSPLGFLSGADDKDKANVPMILLAAVFVLGVAIGIVFTIFEHSQPLKSFVANARLLKQGQVDLLPLAKFKGDYRVAATDINAGIERVAEKGGGAPRKAADLESILGPVPAQPAMSAFAFPMDASQASQGAPTPATGATPAAAPRPAPPPSSGQLSGTGARPAPPVPRPPQASGPGFAPPMTPAAGAPPRPPPPSGQNDALRGPMSVPLSAPMSSAMDDDDDEATMVGRVPEEVLAQATGENKALGQDEQAEWLSVYDDFIKTKKQCGESTDGLTFEKFAKTLKKNRDELMSRHGCKRVKFSVYVKEGRASLKATPVKE
ncbi:MAG: MXAN_5187 family protein [Polyangiaceae bacterium]